MWLMYIPGRFVANNPSVASILFEGTKWIRWYCTSEYGTVRLRPLHMNALAIDWKREHELTYLRITCYYTFTFTFT